ncbi:hypothetical protein CN450_21985 [Bacillus cereus]|nr:hypothetical protein CN450_21985 [Bacillus cereus]
MGYLRIVGGEYLTLTYSLKIHFCEELNTMNLKNISVRLLLVQLFSLVLELFISSSRMLFLPWFVEASFGLLRIFVTTPLLLFIRITMAYLKKRKGLCITRTRQKIPFSYY